MFNVQFKIANSEQMCKKYKPYCCTFYSMIYLTCKKGKSNS